MSSMGFLISVVLSDCGTLSDFCLTLASLREQTYGGWRLVMSGDLADRLSDLLDADLYDTAGRVETVDVSRGSLAGIGGDYVFPLLAGDELAPDALRTFADTLADKPLIELLYGDHAELFGGVRSVEPFFKPDWSPEFLIATNYIGRGVLAAARFNRDPLPLDYDATDLWGCFLAVARLPNPVVVHVERLVAIVSEAANAVCLETVDKARSLVKDHLLKLGMTGEPRQVEWARRAAVVVFSIEFPDDGPSVAIIIPTRNNVAVLKRCLDSLVATTYRNFEIVVVDNNSDDPRTVAYIDGLSHRVLRIPSLPSGFSYSYVNNKAVDAVKCDLILFLNDDIEVIEPRWLSQMVGWLQLDGVATVGARLLYPQKRVQHVGIVNHLLDGVLPGVPYRWQPDSILAPRGQDRTVRNYSALTAACLLMRRDEFVAAGGFDDVSFSVAYNDCDLGFRLTQTGRRQVFEPSAVLCHHEGRTRGRGRGNDKIAEERAFIDKYRHWKDVFFNANLAIEYEGMKPTAKRLLSASSRDERIGVAFVSHNLNYEGAPLVLFDIVKGVIERSKTEVTVFSPVDGPLRARYEALGCAVEILPAHKVFKAKTRPEVRTALDEIIGRIACAGADVVVANTVLTHWVMLAAERLHLPAVWIIHESEPPFAHLAPHGAVHVELAASAMQKAAANVFVCRATRKLYDGYLKRYPAEVIYNGFDANHVEELVGTVYSREEERQRLGVDENDVVAITPGSVCERKSQIDLVRAIERLPQEVANRTVFLIVGARDNDYTKRLREALEALPDARRQRVRVIDETPEIMRYYIASDMMVFTSRLESFPRVIQEAMYFGLGIITTPTFGVAEQLIDGKTALFFAPGDVDALAARVVEMVRDPNLRARLGLDAKLALGRFPTIEEMQDTYWDLIRRVYRIERGAFSSVSRNWVLDTSIGRPLWWETFLRGGSAPSL